MSKGTVKYFNDAKGWGFIVNDDDKKDIYVHYTAINMSGYKTLREGQDVSFELTLTDNGPQAQNVQVFQ